MLSRFSYALEILFYSISFFHFYESCLHSAIHASAYYIFHMRKETSNSESVTKRPRRGVPYFPLDLFTSAHHMLFFVLHPQTFVYKQTTSIFDSKYWTMSISTAYHASRFREVGRCCARLSFGRGSLVGESPMGYSQTRCESRG